MLSRLSSRFQWVDRDTRILVIVRGIRTIGQSTIQLMLALYLNLIGFNLIQIGLILSLDVAGTFCTTMVVVLLSNRFGKRRTLAGVMFLAALASLVMAFTQSLPLIIVAIFFGSFTAGIGAGGPLQPLEVAGIAEVAPAERRTRLLALMFMVGTTASAFGALLLALPNFLEQLFHIDRVTAFRIIFLLYAAFQVIAAFSYMRLSPLVEAKTGPQQWSNPFKLRSRKRIFTLSALSAVDGFGSSIVNQSLIALWFSLRFGMELGSLSLVFFFASLLSAASLWTSTWIAERIGLVKTIPFTQIPTNLLLIAMAFSPAAWVAISFWQLHSLFSKMDIPPRESFTMAVVESDERVATAAITGAGRSGASIIGPSVGTALWNAFGASMPFVGSGVVKITYDLIMYAMFRKVKPPEEKN